MSLPDERTRALWLFHEQHDSVLPSDRTGNLGDLAEGASNTLPAVVDGTIIGFGREFVAASTTGLEVVDTNDDLELTRDMTILMLVRLDVADQDTAGTPGTVIQHGTGGAGDAVPFGLKLEIEDVASKRVRMRLSWHTVAETLVEDVGVSFTWPDGEELLLAAVREVIDGQLQVRYQVNGESKDGDLHALDVGSATGQTVYLGVGHSGAAYENYLDGVIDALEVVEEAVSREELRWIWQRMAVDQPAGVAAMRRYVPPGVYSTDPDSSVQRELALQGMLLGLAKNTARRLRDYFLPNAAWGSVLARWEKITGFEPKPGDWLQRRRDRVLGYLATVQGFARESIKLELAELFDLDSADIEILEYDNDISHDFASDPGDQIQANGDGGSWIFSAGARFQVTLGDIRFHGNADDKAGWLLWPVVAEEDAWIQGVVDSFDVVTGTVAGLMLGSRAKNEWLLFVFQTATSADVQYATYKGGVLSSWTTLEASVADPVTLRAKYLGGGQYELDWGGTPQTISNAPAPEWAGYVATNDNGSTSLSADVGFGDFLIHAPNGDQRFSWMAFRDSALPGEYDLEGAHLLVQRVKPAHTIASAVDTKALTCDEADSLTERGPLGL